MTSLQGSLGSISYPFVRRDFWEGVGRDVVLHEKPLSSSIHRNKGALDSVTCRILSKRISDKYILLPHLISSEVLWAINYRLNVYTLKCLVYWPHNLAQKQLRFLLENRRKKWNRHIWSWKEAAESRMLYRDTLSELFTNIATLLCQHWKWLPFFRNESSLLGKIIQNPRLESERR